MIECTIVIKKMTLLYFAQSLFEEQSLKNNNTDRVSK